MLFDDVYSDYRHAERKRLGSGYTKAVYGDEMLGAQEGEEQILDMLGEKHRSLE